MKRFLFAACAMLLTSAAPAPAPATVEMWRLQCGKDQPLPLAMFSDTYRYGPEATKPFTFSCYLIRHGKDYMIWDAGLPAEDGWRITDQLRQLKITPQQIGHLGLSHYHFDHIAQSADFPGAILLLGAGDFAAVKEGGRLPDNSTDSAERLAPWISGSSKVQPMSGDLDVFGDGSVVVLSLPGHTPGHHALLVRLPQSGNYLLSGDLYHFPENREIRGVPNFNTDRADTIASMARFEELAKNLKAKVIIQHEPADIAKLPTFPASAR